MSAFAKAARAWRSRKSPGRCSKCNMLLRPQFLQELKRGDIDNGLRELPADALLESASERGRSGRCPLALRYSRLGSGFSRSRFIPLKPLRELCRSLSAERPASDADGGKGSIAVVGRDIEIAWRASSRTNWNWSVDLIKSRGCRRQSGKADESAPGNWRCLTRHT